MALKGTTKIELTNVKTGEVEVIEKDNLVTNAVPSALENPFAWQLKTPYASNHFSGNILPLCPNLFGGILLYEDAIPEDANQLYAQTENKLIGYSSNNVNNKTDIMRGSMNQNESGALEDGSGYRFVFDFTTAQANGTISALGLTSKWGGVAGYGSMDFENTQSPLIWGEVHNSVHNGTADEYARFTLVHYDDLAGIASSVYVSETKHIRVTHIPLHTKNWRLRKSNMKMLDRTVSGDAQTFETSVFAASSPGGPIRYCNFCDGGDGYVWGFEHASNAAGNSSGKATVNWIKIKMDDLSVQEGTWEIDAQIYPFGRMVAVPGSLLSSRSNDQANCVVREGYLYCINNKCTGIYKINLANVTDVSFVEHPDKAIPVYSKSGNIGMLWNYFTANLVVAGNKVCCANGYLNGDEIVKHGYAPDQYIYTAGTMSLHDGWIDTGTIGEYPFRNYAGAHPLKLGVYSLYFNAGWTNNTSYTSDAYAHLLLDSPYLATINNLPAPVQKTADKTMKITYILREES